MKSLIRKTIATICLIFSGVLLSHSLVFGQALEPFKDSATSNDADVDAIRIWYNAPSDNTYLFVYKQITNPDPDAKSKTAWKQVGFLSPSDLAHASALFIDPPSSKSIYKIAQAEITYDPNKTSSIKQFRWLGLCQFNVNEFSSYLPSTISCGKNNNFGLYNADTVYTKTNNYATLEFNQDVNSNNNSIGYMPGKFPLIYNIPSTDQLNYVFLSTSKMPTPLPDSPTIKADAFSVTCITKNCTPQQYSSPTYLSQSTLAFSGFKPDNKYSWLLNLITTKSLTTPNTNLIIAGNKVNLVYSHTSPPTFPYYKSYPSNPTYCLTLNEQDMPTTVKLYDLKNMATFDLSNSKVSLLCPINSSFISQIENTTTPPLASNFYAFDDGTNIYFSAYAKGLSKLTITPSLTNDSLTPGSNGDFYLKTNLANNSNGSLKLNEIKSFSLSGQVSSDGQEISLLTTYIAKAPHYTPPTNVQATNISYDSATITWDPTSTQTGVTYAVNLTCNSKAFSNKDLKLPPANFTGLPANATCDVVVIPTYNSIKQDDKSANGKFQTASKPSFTPPNEVQATNITKKSATITWGPTGKQTGISYQVKVTSDPSIPGEKTFTKNVSEPPVRFSRLGSNVVYKATVTAIENNTKEDKGSASTDFTTRDY